MSALENSGTRSETYQVRANFRSNKDLTVMATSDIEWTEATWNPLAGCTIVSPGCSNCYAMRMAARLQAMGMQKYVGTTRKSGRRNVWTGRINIDPDALSAPLTWRK